MPRSCRAIMRSDFIFSAMLRVLALASTIHPNFQKDVLFHLRLFNTHIVVQLLVKSVKGKQLFLYH